MHGLETIRRINSESKHTKQDLLRWIDESTDIEKIKEEFCKLVVKHYEKPFCSKCGQASV